MLIQSINWSADERSISVQLPRIKVGIIGLGGMGKTHLAAYLRRPDAQIVALSDLNEKRLGDAAEKVLDGVSAVGMGADPLRRYDHGLSLIADQAVELVDICVPTPAHYELAMAAIKVGKHVLVEKPVARTRTQTRRLAAAAVTSSKVIMPAMCMRFWPGWRWLKNAIVEQRYGRLLSANFRRLGSTPGRETFYLDGRASGGAILDLHIHDVDFILWCWGMPAYVHSGGYIGPSGHIDHVLTQYGFADAPLITAEGAWTMADGYGFSMQYLVTWERATAAFGLLPEGPLVLIQDGRREVVAMETGDGYDHEIGPLLARIRRPDIPPVVTMRDAEQAWDMVEAEIKSVTEARRVKIKP